MKIREGNQQDIPAILRVLKASLGETSSRKTEEVWRFKHLDNPFGESLVLLAEEEGEVIGVRAFMRWKWQQGSQVFSAFRAVDTATHPDHQGKGVFKKLTLKALEIAKDRGDHFVFNTPNSQSRPGYIKMGWKEVDKLITAIRPVNPFYWKSGPKENFKYSQIWEVPSEEEFLEAYNNKWIRKNKLFTPKNLAYLKWRYLDNPLQEYQVLANADLFLAGYVKDQGRFRELRISEALRAPGVSSNVLRREIKAWARLYGVHFVSYGPGGDVGFKLNLKGKFGPVLTFRNINLEKDQEKRFLDIRTWTYSLGELELF